MSQLDENSCAMDILSQLMIIIWPFIHIFFVCEFGQRLSGQFDMLDAAFCQCKWYLLSIELQRMLVIVMSITQQPVILQGYGNIQCTRGSFKQVKIFIFFCFQLNDYIDWILFLSIDSSCRIFIFYDATPNYW